MSIQKKVIDNLTDVKFELNLKQLVDVKSVRLDKLSYDSPFNPCFISQIENYKSSHKIILIRDGIVPIISFFLSNPDPDFYEYILVVPLVARFFVPKTWQERIVFYENVNKISSQKLKHLYLYTPDLSEIKDESILFDEIETLQRNNNFISTQLNISHDLPRNEDDYLDSLMFHQKLFRMFNEKVIKGDELQIINKNKNLSGVMALNLSQPVLIYDSYLFHFFGSRDACYFVEREYQGGYFYALGDNFGHELFLVDDFVQEIGVMYSQIKEAIKGRKVTKDYLMKLVSN